MFHVRLCHLSLCIGWSKHLLTQVNLKLNFSIRILVLCLHVLLVVCPSTGFLINVLWLTPVQRPRHLVVLCRFFRCRMENMSLMDLGLLLDVIKTWMVFFTFVMDFNGAWKKNIVSYSTLMPLHLDKYFCGMSWDACSYAKINPLACLIMLYHISCFICFDHDSCCA